MKTTHIASLIASAGIGIAGLSYAYQHIAPYLSEESCIIQAAQAAGELDTFAVRACRSRFEDKGGALEELPPWVVLAIEGRASFDGSSVWTKLYNGDSSYVITRLRIGITDPETKEAEEPDTRYYNVSVDMPPLSPDLAEFEVFQTYDTISWHIAKAWGHRVEE